MLGLRRILPWILVSCGGTYEWPEIGEKIVHPSFVTSFEKGFYVLMGDASHQYRSGSLWSLNAQGERLGIYSVPRLGNALTVAGDNLFAAFEGDEKLPAQVLWFQGASQGFLEQKKAWSLPACSPIQIAAKEGYPLFAVSCREGPLYLGSLEDSSPALDLVRNYPRYARRALYLDPLREVLLGFVTDMERTLGGDELLWAQDGDIPQVVKDNPRRLRETYTKLSRFQMTFLDLKEEKNLRSDGHFVERDYKERNHELRWFYGSLENWDGTLDDDGLQSDHLKHYRTNFWQVEASPSQPHEFFLSQRSHIVHGVGGGNHIVKVQWVGDPRPYLQDGVLTAPPLDSYLSMERVFGFKDQEDPQWVYPSSFHLSSQEGIPWLIVNHFRDPASFLKPYYALVAYNLSGGRGFFKKDSFSKISSFGDFAELDGKILVSSFYDHRLWLFSWDQNGFQELATMG